MKNRIFFILLVFLTAMVLGCTDTSKPKIETLENPASSNSQFPYLFASGNTLYMSWISTHEQTGVHSLNYAGYTNGNWDRPHTIAKDSTWFVNWADFPSLIAGPNDPLAAHWLKEKTGGTYAYDVNISMAKSSNQWSPELIPHHDSTATEHGFVSMIRWDDTTILAVWLDGRRTANRTNEEYYDLDKAMTLRGALISADGNIKEKFLIDDSVCDCCQTSLVKTSEGAVVAYRNRTDDEIRDIYASRFDGNSWAEPKLVHKDGWKIGACPVNGPMLAASDSKIVVAWHTAADDNPTIKAAVSRDEGRSFNDPVSLNNRESLGRVDAAIRDDGKAYISWMESSATNENKAHIKLASYDIDKRSAVTKNIASINSSRQSGFPQMEILGNELIFAWTDVDSANTEVRTKIVQNPF